VRKNLDGVLRLSAKNFIFLLQELCPIKIYAVNPIFSSLQYIQLMESKKKRALFICIQ